MKKVMVVSYKRIGDLPQGRSETKKAIAHSAVAYSLDGSWKLHYYDAFFDVLYSSMDALPSSATPEQEATAKEVLIRLKDALLEDLKVVETVYIYVGGENATPDALKFVRKIRELGKSVHIVACYCQKKTKVDLANELGINIVFTRNCNDAKEFCGKLFEQHSKPLRQNRQL